MYGGFKKDLGEVLVATLEPLQQRYHEIRSSGTLSDILAEGAERARNVASQTLAGVKERMGFLPYR
ncbi:Tryptophan--tRNA ligase [compost metagenome]